MSVKREIKRLKRTRRKAIGHIIIDVTRFYFKGDEDKMFGRICDGFVELGGIYVKFLQGVLLQSPRFQHWLEANHYKVFEKLEPSKLDIHELLQYQLKDKVKEFKSVAAEPFAAGSFGQVYRAELTNGQSVIIKVLRPYIREILRYDTRMLGRFGWFFIKTVTTLDANIKSGTRYIFETTMRETDYVYEAKMAARMYEAFKDDPQIVIPKTYADLSTSHILVQDYIGGLSIAELISATSDPAIMRQRVYQETGSNLEEQIADLGYKFFISLFSHGLTHGDLHPGNVRLLPNNQIAMLDFGIVVEKPAQPYIFYKFLEQFDLATHGQGQPADIFIEYVRMYETDLFYALEAIDSFSGNKYNIMGRLKTYINTVFFDSNDPSEFTGHDHDAFIGAHINKTVNKANRFGIVAHLKNADVLRAAQTYHTLCVSVDAFHVIAPVYSAVVYNMKRLDPSVSVPPPNPLSIDQAFEIVSHWLQRVAERDSRLFRTLKNLVAQAESNVPLSNSQNVR